MFINPISLCAPSIMHFAGTFIGLIWIIGAACIPQTVYMFIPFISRYGYLPTLLGSWYFNNNSRLLSTLFCLSAIMLFVIHPVGSAHIFYSFYWLIPAIISITGIQNTFIRYIGTAWIMHACGTLGWLYTGLATPAAISTLTWIAPIERFVIATLMYSVHYCISYGYTKIRVYHQKNRASHTASSSL